jgi:hypothetical protein
MFLGSYAILWQLTPVALPSILLILIGLARQISEEYTRPGAIVEQAVSAPRTMYSSRGAEHHGAVLGCAGGVWRGWARLGIKQGLHSVK